MFILVGFIKSIEYIPLNRSRTGGVTNISAIQYNSIKVRVFFALLFTSQNIAPCTYESPYQSPVFAPYLYTDNCYYIYWG